MSDSGGPDYSTLADVLSQISQQRANYENSNPQQLNPGSAVGSGGSFGIQQAYNDYMAKLWSYYGGMNLQKNTFGVAPQILDNQKETQWMQSALQDPTGVGSGMSGGMLHTPQQQFTPDNGPSPQQQRAQLDPYSGSINSNTGIQNGVDPHTGQPYYNGTNAPPTQGQLINGGIGQLAQSPQHASDLLNYLTNALGGGGGGYNSGGGGSTGGGGMTGASSDMMQAYPGGNNNG